MLGGEHPLDGVSYYESKNQEDHYHFVTYGFSELYYNEEKVEGEFSKWGFELTFRLKPFEADNGNPSWAVALYKTLPNMFLALVIGLKNFIICLQTDQLDWIPKLRLRL